MGCLVSSQSESKCNDDEACFKYRGVGSREAEYRQGDGDGTFEVEGQGFGMEIDLENVDWKVLKFTGTAKAFKKTFNDAFIRKFGHYLK